MEIGGVGLPGSKTQPGAAYRFGADAHRPWRVAHRGAQLEPLPSGEMAPRPFQAYVENTLPAFLRAAELGVDALELDVIATRDGRLAVYHDDRIGRVFRLPGNATRQPFVKRLTWEQLQQAQYHPQSVTETLLPKLADVSSASCHLPAEPPRIPSLEAVLEQVLAVNPNMQFFVELKTSHNKRPTRTNGLERQVAKLIQARNLYDQVTVIGFNPWSLWKIKRLDPRIRTGLDFVVADWRRLLNARQLMRMAKRLLRVEVVLPPYQDTDEKLVENAHKMGLRVFPWVWRETVQQEVQEADRLAALGVAGVISNAPAMILQNDKKTPLPLS
jgi:glycerophosphoryl diester phosphodiesterase